MVAPITVVVVALTQFRCTPSKPTIPAPLTSTMTSATESASGTQRMRPLPSPGMRSLMWLRSGNARPRTISTTMMTRNGTDFDHPGAFRNSGIQSAPLVSSASMTPIRTPPRNVSGNDVKFPTSAAASEGTRSSRIWLTDNPMIGTTRIPAKPASPAPADQLIVAITSGERPRVAAASSFSATARVINPNRV